MYLRLSTNEPLKDNYFWGCSAFPVCKNIENTILRKQDFSNYYLHNTTANSIKLIRPNDNVPDAERHYALCKTFQYDHKFGLTAFDNLDFLLGFEEQIDFFFWLATQYKFITHGVHNYLPVGSPYYFTFKTIIESINQNSQNTIDLIIREQSAKIEASIIDWTNYFNLLSEQRENRIKVSEEVINVQHKEAVERKSAQASFDIFNAIRRKDVKAIIALRKKGADLSKVNDAGLNSLKYAKSFNNDNLIEALTTNNLE